MFAGLGRRDTGRGVSGSAASRGLLLRLVQPRHELERWAEQVVELGTAEPTIARIAAAFRYKQLDLDYTIELAEIGLAMPLPELEVGVGTDVDEPRNR